MSASLAIQELQTKTTMRYLKVKGSVLNKGKENTSTLLNLVNAKKAKVETKACVIMLPV